MNHLIDCLCSLYFTKLEARIYVTLIKEGELSGYQIAKKIDISRSSVYSALEPMYEKGMVLCRSEGTQIYSAQNPVTLLERLRKDYNDNAKEAEAILKDMYADKREEKFTNISGYETVIANAKELLLSAEKEVYINTDFDLHLFKKEIEIVRERGVRIIVFSFADLKCGDLDVEVYSHNRECYSIFEPSRLMMVTDFNETLVADTYKERGTWLGTITNNALLTSIVSEHIHHDIYILRLEYKYNKKVIDESILLGTLLEKR